MSTVVPRFSITLLSKPYTREQLRAINNRGDFVVRDYYDQIAQGGEKTRPRAVIGSYLQRRGESRVRLPKNFQPESLDNSGETIYGQYDLREAAHWSGGKLHRWGVPKGYRECLAQGRDRQGRWIALAWDGDREITCEDAFVWDGKQLHLLRRSVGRGDGSYGRDGFTVWLWDQDRLVTLPAPAGFTYADAKPALVENEFLGSLYTFGSGIACRWRGSVCTKLPSPAGAIFTAADYATRRGWVVGTASWNESWRRRLILWSGDQVVRVQDRLTEQGWHLLGVIGVTPDGEIYAIATRNLGESEFEQEGHLALLRPIF